MATSANLPLGEFITSINGKRCTAVPRTDISTQSSTTSTFSSFSTLSTSPSQAPAVQATTLQTTPPPAVTTTSASIGSFSTISSTSDTASNISPAAVVPQVQSSVADTSTAALTTTSLNNPPLAATASSSIITTSATAPQSEVQPTDSTTAAPFTTIGIAGQSTTSSSAADTSASVVSVSTDNGGNDSRSTAAVAGGVVGGVALISLIAFFIWFWRRRVLKKRRSTLLTPLSTETGTGYGGRDLRRFFIRPESVGPPPRSNKVKSAFRAQYGRVRGRIGSISRSASVRSNGSHGSARSVDLNRGNSQYMEGSAAAVGRERKGSLTFAGANRGEKTVKERAIEIWSRLRGGDSRSRDHDLNEKNDIFTARGVGGEARGKLTGNSAPLTNKPDFLTLLNMDDNELDRETARRRVSRSRGGSEGSGVGRLNLDFGEDPFSDVNALANNQARAGPPIASGANNPFSDANAIAAPLVPSKPSTYVQDMRRSRGASMDAGSIDLDKAYGGVQGLRIANEASRPPSGATAGPNGSSFYYRDSSGSAASFESFATKRNKFRSDPFDLEPLSQVSGSLGSYMDRPAMPALNFAAANGASPTYQRFSSSGSISMQYQQSGRGSGILSRPTPAHTRHVSDGSSKYTSGISQGSLGDWSDPGPDVGPGVVQGGVFEPSRRSSGAEAFNPYSDDTDSRRGSKSSSGSSKKMGYAL